MIHTFHFFAAGDIPHQRSSFLTYRCQVLSVRVEGDGIHKSPLIHNCNFIAASGIPYASDAGLAMLTVNALTAADGVLIPMQCEYYALEGLSALLNTVEQVRDSVNPGLEVYGLLRTMVDPRINLSNEVSEQLISHFDDKVFRTVVPRNVRLAEAPSFGRPVLYHDRKSRGALAYLALAGEVLRREDERVGMTH